MGASSFRRCGATVARVLFNVETYKEGSREEYPIIRINAPQKNAKEDFPPNELRSTKYTAITYLPRVLYEQFCKLTSLYFLIIVVMTSIPAISPISPFTTVIGFLFIIAVAAIRELYEDILRKRADLKVNRKKHHVVESFTGKLVETRSMKISVGDLVYVEENEQMPADLVVLLTSNEDGQCFIETAQLDGETNAKPRRAPKETAGMTREQLSKLTGNLHCEPAHHQIYTFRGSLSIVQSTTIPLSDQHLLPKSTHLKNTKWIIGICAYAGPETKLALNQKKPPSKMSTVDKRMNLYVLGILIGQFILCALNGVLAGFFEYMVLTNSWYLAPSGVSLKDAFKEGVLQFFSYFILLSFLIPLSLVVSLEVIKVVQAKFMEWDVNMMHGKKHMVAKTSSLNDELGLVEYVFSDKTGTLTQNIMKFQACSVASQLYSHPLSFEGRPPHEVEEFFTILALCHTANVDLDEHGEVTYKASSPDEEALVAGAAANGILFERRNKHLAYLNVYGEEREYEVLEELEFTSDRRRMSVVVRDPEGSLWLWSKGADSMMYSRLRDSDPLKHVTQDHLKQFSAKGLRTLVLGRRKLTEEQYQEFHSAYTEASSQLVNREGQVEEICDKFERGFEIVGATAIEDKLQEHVPKTIQYLLDMGIHVWMITGDKQETAISIGHSTQLIDEDTQLIIVNAESTAECQRILNDGVKAHCGDQALGRGVGLVIDGSALEFALEEPQLSLFVQLASECRSVICCRATPLQKAQIVQTIKKHSKAITLAIGDGANDVSMIQEAHVGVGIFGREGSQAAQNSDYALRQFSHLQRLLAIHGRYSLLRSVGVIHFSLYKNAAIFLVQVWYSFFSGFSSQSLYDDWMMTFFNVFVTAQAPLIYGIFEKDIGEKLINTHPEVYTRTQSKRMFTWKTVSLWMIEATWHSVVFFAGAYFVYYYGNVTSDGTVIGLHTIGAATMSVGVTVIFLRLALETNYWTALTHLVYWGSLLFYFLLLFLESQSVVYLPTQYAIFEHLVVIPGFWAWLLLACGICLLPVVCVHLIQRSFFMEGWQALQYAYRDAKKHGHGFSMVSESPFYHTEKILYKSQTRREENEDEQQPHDQQQKKKKNKKKNYKQEQQRRRKSSYFDEVDLDRSSSLHERLLSSSPI